MSTIDQIAIVAETYRDRFNANDADGLAGVYDADIVFVNLAGQTFHGREATRDQQARGFAGPLAHVTIDLHVEDLDPLSPHHVVARLRQTIHDPDHAVGTVSASVQTWVLDRTSGSWLIRHLQNTPILP